MTINKLENGQYRVDLRPQGRHGKRIRKLFATKSEAQQFERHTLATQNNKEWLDKPADRRPLIDLIELWWKHHGQTLKSGKANYSKLKLLAQDLGFPRVNKVTKNSFAEYKAMRLEKGIKSSTINRTQMLLSGVFTVLIENQLYHNAHPLKGMGKIKVNAREMSFLSKNDIMNLLENLSGDNAKAVKLSLVTGARWGEIKSLNRKSVIKYKVTYVNTKNGKNRTVPISKKIYEEITAGENHLLFQNANYPTVRKTIVDLFPWLPERQSVHVLRHTFASHFMMGGGNIITLQKILGHSSISQTMTYAHFAPDYLQDAIRLNPLESD